MEALEGMSRELRGAGIPSVVIGKREIKGFKKPVRVAAVDPSGDSMKLLSPKSETLLTLDGSRKCLLVLGTMEHGSLSLYNIRKKFTAGAGGGTLQGVLRQIVQNYPVVDIYPGDSEAALRLDITRFNFRSLGDEMTASAAINFSNILKKISSLAGAAVLDTGFGQVSLPFIEFMHTADLIEDGAKDKETKRQRELDKFTVYSRFVQLAYVKGIFGTDKGAGGVEHFFPDVPILKEMGAILWGGPVITRPEGGETPVTGESGAGVQDAPPAPLPPGYALAYRASSPSSWLNFFRLSYRTYWRYIRRLGPLFIVLPLSLVAAGSFTLAYSSDRPELLAPAALFAGIILFIHSFELIKRKRIIENCPTSNVHTMPMGEVEVNGIAEQRYALRSPHSHTKCVYYSYKTYYRNTVTGSGGKRTLREWGTSGRVPFYLKGEKGRVLVDPEGAILRLGYSRREDGTPWNILTSTHNDWETEETVIPVGRRLFITGFARRVHMSTKIKHETYVEKLRALKTDRHRLMQYDSDMDGKLDPEEWDRARKAMEDETLMEYLGKAGADDIAIGQHPSGGLFYIADRPEKKVLTSMAWRIPLSLALGVAGIVGGAGGALHYSRGLKAILRGLFG
jgi:hypothetical protein